MLTILILMGSTLVLMLIGLPIAFAILCGSILALISIGNILLLVIPQDIFIGLDSFSLLAIPFFVLAGSLMTAGGITDRLLVLANAIMGRFRGGLAMSVFIIFGIRSGIFNVTECAVVAAIYALLVGVFGYKKINFRVFWGCLGSAARTTTVIMVIIATAKAFNWVLAYVGIPRTIADFVLATMSDPLMFFLFLNLLLLIVGMFIETNAAIVMLAPVFFSIAMALGIDRTHFKVVFVVNLCIGLITPPTGLCLNIASVLARTSLEDGVRGIFPYLMMALSLIALLTLFPGLVTVFS